MDILIAGAGSIGSVLAVLIAEQKNSITCLRRSPPFGKVDLHIYGTVDRTAEVNIFDIKTIPRKVYDVIFITTQAQHTDQILSDLKDTNIYSPDTIFVSLQNGLNGPSRLCKQFPQSKILGGAVWWSATLYSPTEILYHRKANTTIGVSSCSKADELDIQKLVTLLQPLQDITVTNDIEGEPRKKLILNVVSPILALVGKPYPQGLSNKIVRETVHLLFDEAIQIAHNLHWNICDDRLDQFHNLLKYSDEEFSKHLPDTNSQNQKETKFTHKVSTLLGLEKYGRKGSNVHELLDPFVEQGSQIILTIINLVENLSHNLSYNEILDKLKQVCEQYQDIPCLLDK